MWGHVGVYGYSRRMLELYDTLPAGRLEGLERLEQLRFIEAGHRFRTIEAASRPVGVEPTKKKGKK